MGISQQGFFLYRYRGSGLRSCTHDLLVRVRYPAYSNADQGAEDAALAFGDSAALHLRTWWERYELPTLCRRDHETSPIGEASEEAVEDEALFGPGLRMLDVWFRPGALATHEIDGATRHRAYLLTDEDGHGDLSTRVE
jgi:hypothetical protein